MNTVALSGNLQIPPPPVTSDQARLVAEVAERLIEWSDMACRERVLRWVQRVAGLGRDCPPAMWIYLRLQTGDMSELTRSYRELGIDRCESKQAVQQELERVMAVLTAHYPEMADAVQELRRISFVAQCARA